jgi:hypothetical protein
MTHEEFLLELEKVSGIQYSEENSRFFYTAITNQFKAYKKSYDKLTKYIEAFNALHPGSNR